MLTPKNRAKLKSLANGLNPSVLFGKGEVDDGVVQSVSNALEAHELIKVRILQNSGVEKYDLAEEIAKRTHSEVVSIIGRVITLYRRREKNPTIVL